MIMREIKFRAWDSESKVMRHDDYCLRFKTALVTGKYGDEFPEMIPLQYTGLKDREGVEIYEGDIVEFDANYTNKPSGYMNGVMTWDNDSCRFFLKVGERDYDIAEETDEWHYKRKVVGNIYETK